MNVAPIDLAAKLADLAAREEAHRRFFRITGHANTEICGYLWDANNGVWIYKDGSRHPSAYTAERLEENIHDKNANSWGWIEVDTDPSDAFVESLPPPSP